MKDEAGIILARVSQTDAGEALTIQRAAFVSEALIYGTADMPVLTQTLDQLRAELAGSSGWVARQRGRLIGIIHAAETEELLLIGRIAVAPDIQGAGIGKRLLDIVEQNSRAPEAELFTGSLSESNIRLYQKCGYRITEEIDQGDGTAQIFMRKRINGGHREER